MILNLIEKFNHTNSITINSKSISFLELVKKVNFFCEKIKKIRFYNKKLYALDIDDGLDLIIAYLACIELKLSFFPLGQYYNKDEKEHLIKFAKPNYFISNNKIKKLNNNFSKLKKLCIFFTSGTTSRPKGILHDTSNLIKNAQAFNKLNKIKKGNFLQIFPMSYMAGFLNSTLCPLLAGSNIIISKEINNYNLLNFWHYIKKYKINYTWISPAIIKFLNETKSLNYNTKNKFIKKIFVGTAPFHKNEKKLFYKNFKIYPFESYGSTEMLLVSSNINKNQGSGRLLDGVKIKISKSNELLINSIFRYKGILKKNQKIIINYKKFFPSGDIGSIKNKYLYLSDRKKELIIKDGINISPKYIEDQIIKLDGVLEVAIVGKKNVKTLNEEIICFLNIDKDSNEKVIKRNILNKLSKINHPNNFFFVNSLLRNKIGKIQKNKLLVKYDFRS